MTADQTFGMSPSAQRMLVRALRDLEANAQALFNADEQADSAAKRDGLPAPLRRGFGSLRRAQAYFSPTYSLLPKADWANRDIAAGKSSLPVYPGHGSALLQVQPHVTVGYIVDGGEPEKIGLLVRSVFLAQRSKRNFAPIFITTSTHFAPFLRHGYIFEYLVPPDKFSGDSHAYKTWRQKRIEFIAAKWGIAHFVDSGLMPQADAFPGFGQKSRLIIYPDYAEANPYIKMMYGDLQDDYDCSFGSVEQAAALARHEPVTLHLHWEDAIVRGVRSEDVPDVMANFIACLDRLKAYGGRFFWTVHNLTPHDSVDQDLSLEFTKQLVMRANCIHVHDDWIARRIAHVAPTDAKIVTIEHPSYANCYPEKASCSTARASLGLDDEQTIFLCFGNIRRYKGIDKLLNLAPSVAGRATFVIAGRSGSYDPRGAPPENCYCIDGHIDDEKLSLLYSAADFAVMPFEQMTTSGSLLLALSFGVPVIAPAHQGVISLVRDGSQGFLYQPLEAQGLEQAIERALHSPKWMREAMGQSAAATAAFRPPEAFSAAVRQMFAQCDWPDRAGPHEIAGRQANVDGQRVAPPTPVTTPKAKSKRSRRLRASVPT
ncbi:glycosyltransferase family 4 protein [Aminobacter sp. AP02]|uniref:glycosyltransferase family 4 protein n=1 Tax=Aminobacter sp. AP02 TaxID=2135737 RepID=UPI000D6C5175|nr:glycosyltransferase family 4 protein [Aminobacter sp. AP02]PWK65646.1 glycosyl transferase family 1 [Aminobacter sp. AP02]